MTEVVTIPTPRGGLARMSRRVMNLAHMLTQNARRHGDRIGFIWGDRSWTWREIDGHVSALAAGLAARGVVKGDRILVHSKNCDEMFWSMFAAFRLGAVWVPTNFRLMPDEVAYLATASGAKAFLCHGDFPDHATAAANPALEFIWRIGEGTLGERAANIIAGGCDIVLHCNGDMDEMRDVVANVPPLAGISLARAKAVEAGFAAPDRSDEAELRVEFEAMFATV